MQEIKRSRGRPATGLKRNKKITIRVTEQEAEMIKQEAQKNNENITNFIVELIKKK